MNKICAEVHGLEVIKLEFILRLTIKPMICCLRTRVRKQPIIALYFESEVELKFYNLEVWLLIFPEMQKWVLNGYFHSNKNEVIYFYKISEQ